MGFMQQFRQQPSLPGTAHNPAIDQLANLRDIVKGNPQGVMDRLMQTNPTFAQFVAQNRGKTPEQAFLDAGLDYSQVRQFL